MCFGVFRVRRSWRQPGEKAPVLMEGHVFINCWSHLFNTAVIITNNSITLFLSREQEDSFSVCSVFAVHCKNGACFLPLWSYCSLSDILVIIHTSLSVPVWFSPCCSVTLSASKKRWGLCSTKAFMVSCHLAQICCRVDLLNSTWLGEYGIQTSVRFLQKSFLAYLFWGFVLQVMCDRHVWVPSP